MCKNASNGPGRKKRKTREKKGKTPYPRGIKVARKGAS
jgi:hypothetical protein